MRKRRKAAVGLVIATIMIYPIAWSIAAGFLGNTHITVGFAVYVLGKKVDYTEPRLAKVAYALKQSPMRAEFDEKGLLHLRTSGVMVGQVLNHLGIKSEGYYIMVNEVLMRWGDGAIYVLQDGDRVLVTNTPQISFAQWRAEFGYTPIV